MKFIVERYKEQRGHNEHMEREIIKMKKVQREYKQKEAEYEAAKRSDHDEIKRLQLLTTGISKEIKVLRDRGFMTELGSS